MKPIRIYPVAKDYLWGGVRLKEKFGKNFPLDKVAETWELSLHKDGESMTEEGTPLSMAIPKEAVGIEGSSMYLKEGEVLTLQELLYGLMLQSGNDAAVALAIYCGGTVEGFAELMNRKADEMGLNATHFDNPHGLDGETH